MVLQTWWCSSAICVYQVSPISNHLSLNVNLSTMCVPPKTSTWSRIVHFFLSLSTLKTKTSNVHSNYFTRFTNFDFMFKKYFVFVQSWCQLKSSFGWANFMQSQVTTVVQNQRQFFPRADAILLLVRSC